MKTVNSCRLYCVMLLCMLIEPLAFSNWSNNYLEKPNPLRMADYEMDADGILHRVYMDYATGSLVMETLGPDEHWIGEVVDGTGLTGYRPNLVFDPMNRPVVIYYDITNNASYMARKLDANWTIDYLQSYPDSAQFLSPKILFDEVYMHGFTTIESTGSEKSLVHFKVPLNEADRPVLETIPMPSPQGGGHFGLFRVRQDEIDPEYFVFIISYVNISGPPPPIGSPNPAPVIDEGLAIGHFRDGILKVGPITPHRDNHSGIFIVDNAFSIIRLTSYADADTPPTSTVQLLEEKGDTFEVRDLPMGAIHNEDLNKLHYIWKDKEERFHFIGAAISHPEAQVVKHQHFIYDKYRNDVFEEGLSDPVRYSEFLGKIGDKHYFIEENSRSYNFFDYDLTACTTSVLAEEAYTYRNVAPRIAKDSSGQVHICKVVENSVMYQNSNDWKKDEETLVEELLTPIIQDFKAIDDTLHLIYTIQETDGSDFPKPKPRGICYIAHLSRPLDASSDWTLDKGILIHPINGNTATKAFLSLDCLDPNDPRIVGIARFYDMVNKPSVTPAELAQGYQVVRCNMNFENLELLAEIEESKPYTFITRLVPWLNTEEESGYLFPSTSGIERITKTEDQWNREIIIPTNEPVSHLDGVMDTMGNLHLTFDSAGLKHAAIPPSGEIELTNLSTFTPGRLEEATSSESLQLIDLDSSGNPVILYSEFSKWPIGYVTRSLRFAEYLNNEWISSSILPGSKGLYADMVEIDGDFHIVYNDYEEGATGYVCGTPARIEQQIPETAQHYHPEIFKSSWFGVMQGVEFPFINHHDHGWLYMDSSTSRQFFWSYELNAWLYTNKAIYPYIYDLNSKQWIYYYQSIKNENWYYLTKDKAYIH